LADAPDVSAPADDGGVACALACGAGAGAGAGGGGLPFTGKPLPDEELSELFDAADLRDGFGLLAAVSAPANVVPLPVAPLALAALAALAVAEADGDGLMAGGPDGDRTKDELFIAPENASDVPSPRSLSAL